MGILSWLVAFLGNKFKWGCPYFSDSPLGWFLFSKYYFSAKINTGRRIIYAID
jgi:hypothetical protein